MNTNTRQTFVNDFMSHIKTKDPRPVGWRSWTNSYKQGYCVEMNSAIGPYKGWFAFSPYC